MAQASQWAGWWSGGSPQVTFTTASDLSYTNKQTPSFSLSVGVGNSPTGQLDINTTGSYNITGLSSQPGFNTARTTQVVTTRIEWPTVGLGSTAFIGGFVSCNMKQAGTVLDYGVGWFLSNSNTQLNFFTNIPSNTGLALPGSYTQYMNRWLTTVWSTSETAASFANWSNPVGSGNYARMAVFDSETGELIAKVDFRGTAATANWSTWPNTVPANHTGSYGAVIQSYGTSNTPNFYNSRISNIWVSFGTMFDPLTTTDTSWRLTRPSATIDTARAWLNLQMTNYVQVGSNYFVLTTGQDLYSAANNYVAGTPSGFNTWDTAEWAAAFSDTITTKDTG